MAAKYKKGMTLIEVIVTLLVVTILLGAIYMVFNQSVSSITKEESRIENQQNMRQVALRIELDLRESDQLTAPYEDGSCYVIDTYKYCLIDQRVSRDSQVIANNIKSLSITTTDNIVSIKMESVPDRYGQIVIIDTEVALRGVRDD